MGEPIRVFIWGSCVTRDTFPYLGDACTLTYYVARQSLISCGTEVTGVDLPTFESPFQQRMNLGDAKGDATRLIREKLDQIDLLLLDLCDERLGVIEVEPGRYLTRSVERMREGTDDVLTQKFPMLALGSTEHIEAWEIALDRVMIELDDMKLLHKTRLMALPWAVLTESGTPTPWSFGMRAAQANRLFQPYYEIAEDAGLTLVGRDLDAIADEEHQWGPAPFHYSDDTYRQLAKAILSSVR